MGEGRKEKKGREHTWPRGRESTLRAFPNSVAKCEVWSGWKQRDWRGGEVEGHWVTGVLRLVGWGGGAQCSPESA